ncbi:MAG: DUF1326 domain-containing protein [Chloroflexi bacterium]|nr:DUF1326 domain-containing protein [Chloroflexota bacterium]
MTSAATSWWIAGSLFEGCNCELLCPCHVSFQQRASYGFCEAIWGVHIADGAYRDVSLDGLNAAVAAYCPGPAMAGGNWRAVLYLDQSAPPEQEQALLNIFSGEEGGPWARIAPLFANGRFETVRKLQILFSKESRVRKLQIIGDGEVGSLEVEAILGADRQGVAKIINLHNVIHGLEHVMARSNYRIHDQVLRFEGSGKHGLYSEFRWSGP